MRLLTLLGMLAVSSFRSAFGLCLLALALGTASCSHWRPQPPNGVAGLADANATYAVVLDTLHGQKYQVIDQDAAAHTVRVRSHVDEHDAGKVSIIWLSVDASAVHVSATGYLVHPDGTTHHLLNTELVTLHEELQKKLAAGGHAPAVANAAQPPTAALPTGSLPAAWSEAAYDPKTWGDGKFTCLPVKLAEEEQSQLTLRLSNGENADVLLSLAHAPALCRSPAECKLPGGCPALGIADADRVSRLAGRISKHEVSPLATLISHGQPVATIDLSKHGSIAQAMAASH